MLAHLLKRLVRAGDLVLIEGRGRRHVFGDNTEPHVCVRLKDPSLGWSLAINPSLRLGEAYMNGTLTIEEGDLIDFLAIIARNFANARGHPLYRTLVWLDRLARPYNTLAAARRNVAHHYDLSDRLYDLFLDSDRQYSCAYFETAQDTLEEAQAMKKSHIARKLLLDRTGLKILDIGCGWGGLALHLARAASADVVGITLSEEQLKAALARARREGLDKTARFELRDYREVEGRFDRVVSVGMFEHVGKANYVRFFRQLSNLLADDGVALIHTVGWLDEPSPINPFIPKYIFPGAEIPSLSEIAAVVERSGLTMCDVEILRQHYAHTLRHWRIRFKENRAEISRLYDESFCRMWEFYLAACEVFFHYRTMVVFQIQLTKRLDRLPLTRDYMYRSNSILAGLSAPDHEGSNKSVRS